MKISARVVVVIVGFRNPGDVTDCLHALGRASRVPNFEVFIAENGGTAAMDAVCEALAAGHGPCRAVATPEIPLTSRFFRRVREFRLIDPVDDTASGPRVTVAEMMENYGYAGAINAWLRHLLPMPGWEGVWILNPDTEPTPSALAELVAYATARRRGMVGSRLTPITDSDRIHSRGLAWHKVAARTLAVDHLAPVTSETDPDDIENRLDAPSGASLYVTRDLIKRIGLMDERYFLYYEDLEWGCRAKALHEIGYAHHAVVPHKGGTTIRSGGQRDLRSPLAVYLEFRNRILFVRSRYPAWLPWTVIMQAVHAGRFVISGSRTNLSLAFRGLAAGLRGETGRPDRIIEAGRGKPNDR